MEKTTDRQERVTWWRQQLLDDAHVAVIGAGALGNEVLKNLALMGVGHLHIFDFDKVEMSNLSRTVLFGLTSLGQPKASVAASRIKKLNVNKHATVHGHNVDVVWDLGGGYLRRMDIVLGCLDNLEARLAIGRTCYQLGIPFIDGGIRELGGRVQLHRTGSGACMDCTVGSGEREGIRRRYSCLSVIRSYTPQDIVAAVQVSSAIVAGLMCQEAIKFLQRQSVPFGSVLSWFGETNDFDVLRLVRRPECATCSVAPPRPIVEVPVAVADAAAGLLGSIGAQWSIALPSPFLNSLRCCLCGREQQIAKPSHRCKDTDLFCPKCNNTDLIDLEAVDRISSESESSLLSKTLLELGVPPLAVLLGVSGDNVALFELTGDKMVTNFSKEKR
jgi:adenylyltransferase/sulfurtransferase